jgi:hypothetical protein
VAWPAAEKETDMARQAFLDSVRVARNRFMHPRVPADGPQADRAAAERMLARAAIWLTPRAVKGFNADDFPELGLERQRQLQGAVQDFLNVAKDVHPDKPASVEQFRHAAPALGTVLGILEPYLPGPDDGRTVAEALRVINFPPGS